MKTNMNVTELKTEIELRERIRAAFERMVGTAGQTNFAPEIERLIEIRRELDARKALYEEFDRIVLSLAGRGFTYIDLPEERVELVDNFKGKNTGWTAAAVKRFDLRIETHEKRIKREAKEKKNG